MTPFTFFIAYSMFFAISQLIEQLKGKTKYKFDIQKEGIETAK